MASYVAVLSLGQNDDPMLLGARWRQHYVRSVEPSEPDGGGGFTPGDFRWTADPAEAMRFPTEDAALYCLEDAGVEFSHHDHARVYRADGVTP
jgi:hypothetical protein